MENKYLSRSGFTLIEISVVLVIIGLLVGGILTGRDLMDAAAQRAQISQIERYNTAVNTFRGKYGYLPGDIPDPQASQFGFKSRGNSVGTGDGDGLLLGYGGVNNEQGYQEGGGETVLFWEDLSAGGLIDGSFNTASCCSWPGSTMGLNNVSKYIPLAKIGNGNFIYAYNGGYWNGSTWLTNGFNYFGVSAVSGINGSLLSQTGMTVQQANNIDIKIDDGLPQSGNITAQYLTNTVGGASAAWAYAGGTTQGANGGGGYNFQPPTTNATPYNANNCYDNSYAGGSAAIQKYQLQNANSLNCALSFKFQ